MNATLRLSATVLAASTAATSAAPQDSLQERAAAARAAAGAPALGCVVQYAGEEPRIAVDGVRIVGGEVAVEATDAWHWGSITKSMTATLVARLVEQEKLRWDDTVADLLSDRVPDMRSELAEASFRHLLSHHGGQPPNIPLERFGDFGQEPEDVIAERLEWAEIALAQEPVGAVGEAYAYSNNGYVVAGAMLEAELGVAWEELMRREVFEPLGLTGAGFGAPPGDAPRGHVPGEDGDRPVPPGSDNPAALGPAGRVHMPLADMARYLSAHARRDPEFLSAASWDTLHTQPFTGSYALGWVAPNANGRWHNGSNTMWYAEAAFDRQTGAVAAVVVNDGDIAAMRPVVGELLGELLKGGARSPAEPGKNDERKSDR